MSDNKKDNLEKDKNLKPEAKQPSLEAKASSKKEEPAQTAKKASEKPSPSEEKTQEDKAVAKKQEASTKKQEAPTKQATSTEKQEASTDKKATKDTSSSKEQAPTEKQATPTKPEASKQTPPTQASLEKQTAPENKKDTTETAKPEESPDKSSTKSDSKNKIKLNGFFAFKMSMTSFYNEKGESVPVTALKYKPCSVSQIKNKDKESYSAVQMAFVPQKNKRCSKALIKHLSPAGFKEGARFVKEIRQTAPEGLQLGQLVDIESIQKGDLVKISSYSKGRGFAGVMKRWNFSGGRASHGSKSHRRTGSIGQHTEPARVFPGRKMPGRHGFKKVSRLKVPVVDVLPEEGIIFVKGPVAGARNTLVSLTKM